MDKKLQDLIDRLQSEGMQATIVLYIGHCNDDGEDVIDGAIYEGHPAITNSVISESINHYDLDELLDNL